MLHGDEFGRPDWVLMLLAPPLVGAVIGILLGRMRSRPGLAAIGASVGGALGAWLGVALYRWVKDAILGGRDILIFAAISIGTVLLGAVALGWALSGPKRRATKRLRVPGRALVAACCLVTAAGTYLYLIACEPSAHIPLGPSVKYAGIGCIRVGAGTLVIAARKGGGEGDRDGSRPDLE